MGSLCCCLTMRFQSPPKEDTNNNIIALLSNKSLTLKDFEKRRLLGRGAYGNVFLVKCVPFPNLYFAMKVIHKSRLTKQKQKTNIQNERDILENIGISPFLAILRYAFQDDESLYFITDYAQGGELFFHMKNEQQFFEDKVKYYCAEIIVALNYLHSKKIIYRDLKPENVLIDRDGHVMLTDFGLSKFYDEDMAMTICGTPEYLAPEIIKGEGYDYTVDYWSLGCLTYEMLTGKKAYPSKKMDMGRFKEEPLIYKFLSRDACNFIFTLLKMNPKERTIKPLKEHRFFMGVNFEKIENKKIPPPFIPQCNSYEDVQYFDKEFTDVDINKDIIEFPQSIKPSQNNDHPFQESNHTNSESITEMEFSGFSYCNSKLIETTNNNN